jgi:CBS domain-containing protein
MNIEQVTLIFLAKLAGTPVFDPNGDRLGKIRDAVASHQSSSAPRILGFVIEVLQRRKIFIPITRVTSIDDSGVFITGAVNLRKYQARVGEVALLSELLDREVSLVDKGDRVIIEDLAIEKNSGGEWELTQVHVLKGAKLFKRGSNLTLPWPDIDLDLKSKTVIAPHTRDMNQLSAQEVASILHELEIKERAALAESLDDEKLAEALEEMDDADRVELVHMLEGERVADLLGEMDPDDAADILKEVGTERAESLLKLMGETEAEDMRRLMVYEDYSAGGMMTTDPIVLDVESTVAQALAAVRKRELSPALASQIFLCRPPFETPTGRLLGVIPIQKLLREQPALLLGTILDDQTHAIDPESSVNDVVRHLAHYNLLAAPIVDDHFRLLGAVTVDDVLDHLLPENWRSTPEGEL